MLKNLQIQNFALSLYSYNYFGEDELLQCFSANTALYKTLKYCSIISFSCTNQSVGQYAPLG